MEAFQDDILLQALLLIALAVLFIHCVNRAVSSAIESDRKAIADKLRCYAISANDENFQLLPEHLEEIADDIERGDA